MTAVGNLTLHEIDLSERSITIPITYRDDGFVWVPASRWTAVRVGYYLPDNTPVHIQDVQAQGQTLQSGTPVDTSAPGTLVDNNGTLVSTLRLTAPREVPAIPDGTRLYVVVQVEAPGLDCFPAAQNCSGSLSAPPPPPPPPVPVNGLKAPHQLPPDAHQNPAFAGSNPHVQYPFAELHVRDTATTSGGHEGSSNADPTGE